MLCAVLNDWRDALLSGAGLKTSNLERRYPPQVFRHFQDGGKLPSDTLDQDDFQSPSQPARYIQLRIEPMMDFYTRRIPKYANHGFFLKLTVLLLGVLSSVLAHYGLLDFVTFATAAATVITSWEEFSEDSRKVRRHRLQRPV